MYDVVNLLVTIDSLKEQLAEAEEVGKRMLHRAQQAEEQLAAKDALLQQIKQACMSYIINYGNSNTIRSIVTRIDEELK